MRASQRAYVLAVLLTVQLVDGFSIPKEIATVRAAYDAYDEDVGREGVAPKPKKRKGETFLQKTRRKMGGGRPAAAPPASERGGSDGVAAYFASNDSCKVALSTKGSALSEKI